MGKFIHPCEGEMVCESINPKVPQFNAPIYLENKVRFSRFRFDALLFVQGGPLTNTHLP